MPPTERFKTINGKQLTKYRINRGWSQSELARRAGYSERLIRKAESSGSLSVSTICDLAEALSVDGNCVKLQQLLTDYISIAKSFMDAYDTLGNKMVPQCHQFLSPDLKVCSPADPKQVSFAGLWHGVTGLQTYLNHFFSHFGRSYHSGPPTYLAGEERVSARYYECFSYSGTTFPPIWVHRHFQFEDGMIVCISDEFDTRTFSTYVSGTIRVAHCI